MQNQSPSLSFITYPFRSTFSPSCETTFTLKPHISIKQVPLSLNHSALVAAKTVSSPVRKDGSNDGHFAILSKEVQIRLGEAENTPNNTIRHQDLQTQGASGQSLERMESNSNGSDGSLASQSHGQIVQRTVKKIEEGQSATLTTANKPQNQRNSGDGKATCEVVEPKGAAHKLATNGKRRKLAHESGKEVSMDADKVQECIKNIDADDSVKAQLLAIANAPLRDIDRSKSPMLKRKPATQGKSPARLRHVLSYVRQRRKASPHASPKNEVYTYVNPVNDLGGNSQNHFQSLSLAESLGVDPN